MILDYLGRLRLRILTATDVAQIMDVSPAFVYAETRAGRLTCLHLGPIFLYRRRYIGWYVERYLNEEGAA